MRKPDAGLATVTSLAEVETIVESEANVADFPPEEVSVGAHSASRFLFEETKRGGTGAAEVLEAGIEERSTETSGAVPLLFPWIRANATWLAALVECLVCVAGAGGCSAVELNLLVTGSDMLNLL